MLSHDGRPIMQEGDGTLQASLGYKIELYFTTPIPLHTVGKVLAQLAGGPEFESQNP